MNKELELYKLITEPDIQYVDEFDWIDDEFVIWVSKWWWNEFITRLTQIFGYSIFDEGGFNAKIQTDCICFVLSDITDEYGIDLEEIFPKYKYKH